MCVTCCFWQKWVRTEVEIAKYNLVSASCLTSLSQVGNTSILVYYRSIDLKETDLST